MLATLCLREKTLSSETSLYGFFITDATNVGHEIVYSLPFDKLFSGDF